MVESNQAGPPGLGEASRVPVGASVAVAAIVVVAVALGFAALAADPSSAVTLALASVYGVVGALLAMRRPRNPIGWILLGVLMVFVVSPAAEALGGTALRRGGQVPPGLPGLLVWADTWIFDALFALYYLLALVFPLGHLPGGRGRGAARASLVVILVGLVIAAFSTNLGGPYAPSSLGRAVANPARILPVPDWLPALFTLLTIAFLLAGVASLFVRFARARGIEREQFKWVVAALMLTGTLVILTLFVVLAVPSAGTAPWVIALFGYSTIPPAIAIAVLRYRLYDIDVVIRRTAIYVPLTAVLAGLYAACTAILQKAFLSVTGSPSDGAAILSTLVVAAAFNPVKTAIQGAVDRRFGVTRDPALLLAAFVTDVADELADPAPRRVMQRFLDVAIAATGAGGGVAYAGEPPTEQQVARRVDQGPRDRGRVSGPSPSATPLLEVPVEMQGRRVGRVELSPRRDGRPIAEREVRLLEDAAAAVATAVVGSAEEPPAEAEPDPTMELPVAGVLA